MKLRLNLNQKRLPFGGHHFPEKGVMIKADTFNEVVDLLTNFRLINGRVIGNPHQEVIDYYGSKFPWMVEYDTKEKPDKPVNERYLAWRDWIGSLWGKQAEKYISRKEASMRWEACKGCPHNVGKPWDSSREETEFSRKSMMLRRGEQVDGDLCYCDLHKMDISVSSFVESPEKLSRKAKEQADHPGCWVNISKGS